MVKLLVGVTICKRFIQYGALDWVILCFDAKSAQFTVKYSDGDQEAMSFAKMAKCFPQEYFMLAKEYLSESGRGSKLHGASKVSAIVTITGDQSCTEAAEWKDEHGEGE